MARFRPSDGREPLGLESAAKTSFRIGFQTQRLAFRERKPRHLSSSFNRWESHAPFPRYERGERQNRRAFGTAADENPANDTSSLLEAAGFSSVTGDPIACRSAFNKRYHASDSAFASLRLCVFAGWAVGWALRSLRFLGGRAALRLCVSLWCPPLVSWCLGGSKTIHHS